VVGSQPAYKTRGSSASSNVTTVEARLRRALYDEGRAETRMEKAEAAMSDFTVNGGRDGPELDLLRKQVGRAAAQFDEAAARRVYLEEHLSSTADNATLQALHAGWKATIDVLKEARLALAPSSARPQEDDHTFKLNVAVHSSSDQTAEKFGKQGPTCLPTAYFDPTLDGRLHQALVPTPDDYEAHGEDLPELSSWVLYKLSMQDAAEDEVGKKRSREDKSFGGRVTAHYRHHHEKVWLQPSLQDMNLPCVYATDLSRPDCVGGVMVPSSCDEDGSGDGSSAFVPLRVRVYKRSSRACSDGLPEAFALGTSVAVGLLQGGVPPARVVVPVDVTNGRSMQFGVVYIACDSMPLCWTLSEELDLSVRGNAIKAHLHLRKVQQHVGKMVQLVRERRVQVSRAAPDLTVIPRTIWAKPGCLTHGVYPALHMEASLHHVLSVLTTLSRAGVRDCVCYPLGFGSASKSRSSEKLWYAFFPNLTITSADNDKAFNMKAPDGHLGSVFAAALGAAVAQIHAAGVVHGDLYISNTVWRKPADGPMQVKIIDWDTCFHVRDDIPAQWVTMWANKCKVRGRYSRNKDARELDLFMVRLVAWATRKEEGSCAQQLWSSVASADSVGACNDYFRELQEHYLKECLDEEHGLAA